MFCPMGLGDCVISVCGKIIRFVEKKITFRGEKNQVLGNKTKYFFTRNSVSVSSYGLIPGPLLIIRWGNNKNSYFGRMGEENRC